MGANSSTNDRSESMEVDPSLQEDGDAVDTIDTNDIAVLACDSHTVTFNRDQIDSQATTSDSTPFEDEDMEDFNIRGNFDSLTSNSYDLESSKALQNAQARTDQNPKTPSQAESNAFKRDLPLNDVAMGTSLSNEHPLPVHDSMDGIQATSEEMQSNPEPDPRITSSLAMLREVRYGPEDEQYRARGDEESNEIDRSSSAEEKFGATHDYLRPTGSNKSRSQLDLSIVRIQGEGKISGEEERLSKRQRIEHNTEQKVPSREAGAVENSIIAYSEPSADRFYDCKIDRRSRAPDSMNDSREMINESSQGPVSQGTMLDLGNTPNHSSTEIITEFSADNSNTKPFQVSTVYKDKILTQDLAPIQSTVSSWLPRVKFLAAELHPLLGGGRNKKRKRRGQSTSSEIVTTNDIVEIIELSSEDDNADTAAVTRAFFAEIVSSRSWNLLTRHWVYRACRDIGLLPDGELSEQDKTDLLSRNIALLKDYSKSHPGGLSLPRVGERALNSEGKEKLEHLRSLERARMSQASIKHQLSMSDGRAHPVEDPAMPFRDSPGPSLETQSSSRSQMKRYEPPSHDLQEAEIPYQGCFSSSPGVLKFLERNTAARNWDLHANRILVPICEQAGLPATENFHTSANLARNLATIKDYERLNPRALWFPPLSERDLSDIGTSETQRIRAAESTLSSRRSQRSEPLVGLGPEMRNHYDPSPTTRPLVTQPGRRSTTRSTVRNMIDKGLDARHLQREHNNPYLLAPSGNRHRRRKHSEDVVMMNPSHDAAAPKRCKPLSAENYDDLSSTQSWMERQGKIVPSMELVHKVCNALGLTPAANRSETIDRIRKYVESTARPIMIPVFLPSLPQRNTFHTETADESSAIEMKPLPNLAFDAPPSAPNDIASAKERPLSTMDYRTLLEDCNAANLIQLRNLGEAWGVLDIKLEWGKTRMWELLVKTQKLMSIYTVPVFSEANCEMVDHASRDICVPPYSYLPLPDLEQLSLDQADRLMNIPMDRCFISTSKGSPQILETLPLTRRQYEVLSLTHPNILGKEILVPLCHSMGLQASLVAETRHLRSMIQDCLNRRGAPVLIPVSAPRYNKRGIEVEKKRLNREIVQMVLPNHWEFMNALGATSSKGCKKTHIEYGGKEGNHQPTESNTMLLLNNGLDRQNQNPVSEANLLPRQTTFSPQVKSKTQAQTIELDHQINFQHIDEKYENIDVAEQNQRNAGIQTLMIDANKLEPLTTKELNSLAIIIYKFNRAGGVHFDDWKIGFATLEKICRVFEIQFYVPPELRSRRKSVITHQPIVAAINDFQKTSTAQITVPVLARDDVQKQKGWRSLPVKVRQVELPDFSTLLEICNQCVSKVCGVSANARESISISRTLNEFEVPVIGKSGPSLQSEYKDQVKKGEEEGIQELSAEVNKLSCALCEELEQYCVGGNPCLGCAEGGLTAEQCGANVDENSDREQDLPASHLKQQNRIPEGGMIFGAEYGLSNQAAPTYTLDDVYNEG